MKYLFTCIALYSLLFMTGCPKVERSLRVAKENSAKMSTYGEKLIKANIDAFDAKEISPELLKELNALTGRFVSGVGVYRDTLAVVELAAKQGGADKKQIDYLYDVFDDQVVAAFFALLAKFNVLTGERAEIAKAILASIRLTIRAIQGAFSDARYDLGLPEVSYVTA